MRRYDDNKINKCLDEFSLEYRELLFQQLLTESLDIDDLSVSELIRIDNDVKDYLRNRSRRKKENRLRRIGLLYVLMGVFMFFMGQTLIQNVAQDAEAEMQLVSLISLVVSFAGVIISLLPEFFAPKKKVAVDQSTAQKLLYYEVIDCWNSFEQASIEYIKPSKRATGISIIQTLKDEDLITIEEQERLREFVRIRNAIVHSTPYPISTDEIMDTMNYVNCLSDRLKASRDKNAKE